MQPKTILYYTSILLVATICTVILLESRPIQYKRTKSTYPYTKESVAPTTEEQRLRKFYEHPETQRQAEQPIQQYTIASDTPIEPIPQDWWEAIPERYVAAVNLDNDDFLELVFFSTKTFGLYYYNAASKVRTLYSKGIYNRVDDGSFLLTSDDLSEGEGEHRCANVDFHGLFYSYADLEKKLVYCADLPSGEDVYEVWYLYESRYGMIEKHTGLLFSPQIMD